MPIDLQERNVKRNSLEKRKILKIRNLDLYKERKNTKEAINEG